MLEGRRIAILAEDDFEDSELIECSRAMKDFGARVVIVGTGTKASYKGMRGTIVVTPDISANKVKLKDFDAVIIPGGNSPEKMRLNQPMIDLVRKAHDNGKMIAAICHGPQLLISADVVKGCRITSCPSIAVDLKNAGAIWVDEPVVKHGNIITSRRPADLPRFNKAIMEALI